MALVFERITIKVERKVSGVRKPKEETITIIRKRSNVRYNESASLQDILRVATEMFERLPKQIENGDKK